MQEAPEVEEVRSLKYLRWLVTVLTTVMIVGFIVLIGFLVTRFPTAPSLALPDAITLPDGADALAFTQAARWYAVVTTDDRILIYDRATGTLQQSVTVNFAEK
ncbi:MAG: DUF6476 family protein [Rhodobacter sp.]|nr:DUF6476 family protein [Rhodobacter sp.]